MTEEEWHDLMRVVVAEGRRVLKPTGSMVVVFSPTSRRSADPPLAVGVCGLGRAGVESGAGCVLVVLSTPCR